MKIIKNHVNTDQSPKQKELPAGWILSKLNDISDINPRLDKTKISDNSLVVFVPMASVGADDGKIDISQKRYFSEVKKGFTPFQSGDIIFAKITPCMENGKIAVVPHLENQYGFGSTEFHVIRPKTNIDAHYIYYFLSRLDYRKEAASKMTGAVGQKRVPVDFIKTSNIPVAPLNEQKRIIAEIEKQFSRLDEATAALKRIKANLKRYKASVLKAAVEGKLTEEWRKTHPNVEPASELLKHILTERKRKWEEEYIKKYTETHGHAPKDTTWKKKYKELSLPDTSQLIELPSEWEWVTWEAILSFDKGAFKRGPFGSSLKKSIFVEQGYKIYEQYCPINDDCSFARYFITKEKFKELETFSVRSRDFLISCSGVTLGRITQVPDKYEEGIINQALLRVRINNNVIDDAFFKLLFRSPYFQKQIFDNSTGSAIPNVKGVNDLKAIPLPLPPLEEQKVIIRVIEEHISVVSETERQIYTNLRRAERLRQSILQKAFSGRLGVSK